MVLNSCHYFHQYHSFSNITFNAAQAFLIYMMERPCNSCQMAFSGEEVVDRQSREGNRFAYQWLWTNSNFCKNKNCHYCWKQRVTFSNSIEHCLIIFNITHLFTQIYLHSDLVNSQYINLYGQLSIFFSFLKLQEQKQFSSMISILEIPFLNLNSNDFIWRSFSPTVANNKPLWSLEHNCKRTMSHQNRLVNNVDYVSTEKALCLFSEIAARLLVIKSTRTSEISDDFDISIWQC